MIIYADIVFLVNFFGDFLCLWLLSEICGKIPVWRRLLGAAFGGLFGVLCVCLELSGFSARLLGAVLITAACSLPLKIKAFLKNTVIFFFSSMLLAGGAELAGVNGRFRIMLALLATACLLVGALSIIRSKIYAKYLPCELCFNNKKAHFLGFYDSGNRLVSGEGGQIAVVGDERVLKGLISKEACAENLSEWIEGEKIVQVPFCGAASGMMKGIVLDYLKVGDRRYERVILAVSEGELRDKLVLHSIMS